MKFLYLTWFTYLVQYRIRNAQDEFDKMAEKRMRKSLLPQTKEEGGFEAPKEEVKCLKFIGEIVLEFTFYSII